MNQPIKDNDVIFHVAADYRLWSRKPAEIYAANVLGTENIAQKTLTHNKILIYTSSVATLKLKKILFLMKTLWQSLMTWSVTIKSLSF